MITLIKPEQSYVQSYYEACVVTWGHTHNNYILSDPSLFSEWENTICLTYEKQELGIGLPEGYLPSKTLWLVDTDTHTYIGSVNIRLGMNDTLLDYGGQVGYVIRSDMRGKGFGALIAKLAIEKTHQLGYKPTLLTCITQNVASYKILQNCNYISKEITNTIADGQYCEVAKFWI